MEHAKAGCGGGAAVTDVGVVIIGRNEGERFRRCLRSVLGRARPIVYVDSGSSDGSIAFAEGFAGDGVEVVRLDMSTPFTASRARNAGLDRLLELAPGVALVQFVDGDCEIREGWLEAAAAEFAKDVRVAVVDGRLRERFPEKSIYNRLADLEWDKPVGDGGYCGGNAMMRVERVMSAGKFDAGLLAGEEPDLCRRIKEQGGIVRRLAVEMAYHDIAMTRLGQWWTRMRKNGYGMAGLCLYGEGSQRDIFRRQFRSTVFWGLFFPVLVTAAAVVCGLWWGLMYGLLVLGCGAGLFLVQAFRIARQAMSRGVGFLDAVRYGILMLIAKSAMMHGTINRVRDHWDDRAPAAINYKPGGEQCGEKAHAL
jgi:glycosyltransferase involved in cell wall biosynthesis